MTELVRLGVVTAVVAMVLAGSASGGLIGSVIGLIIALGVLVVPWHGQPLWSWVSMYVNRNRPLTLSEPFTVANDRSGGGVRYQDGVAVAAIQLLGKAYQPTLFTGAMAAQTRNTIGIDDLLPQLHQSLGLTLDSLSVVIAGSRRRPSGDFPRVYDTLIGTPPYAGQRETWLIIRLNALDNGDALQWRSSAGTAVLAAAQRIAMELRATGVRARVATAIDMVELEHRLGRSALEPPNRRWNTARSDAGWQTAYAYRPADITAETLAEAWSIRADGVIQNITLLPDGRASATITVRTPRPLTAAPAVALQPLSGEQARVIAANLCGPRPRIRRLRSAPLRGPVVIPIGPSGVLLGRTTNGDRLLMPLSDSAEQGRVHIAAEDAIAKRIVIRAAAAGERITVHSTNLSRWSSIRMPNIAVTPRPRPAAGTTVSVTDGTVPPAPRPHTVISVGSPGTPTPRGADVTITQVGPRAVEITAAGEHYDVEVEYFRAENLYVSGPSRRIRGDLEMVD